MMSSARRVGSFSGHSGSGVRTIWVAPASISALDVLSGRLCLRWVGRGQDLDLSADLERVASDGLAVLVEDPAFSAVLVDVPARRAVPDVRVLGDETQGALLATSPDQRQPSQRGRERALCAAIASVHGPSPRATSALATSCGCL